ncbi:hypothetical protein [Corynebacterium sp. HS2168-gen11]|uniref:hypothetical protein n=1 Tax=Corynebacterium sp. HS2168-gen11 TaxID=2974027 RepID=UPI00216AC207|nr:hypothetical protein [Corynebacterium sp. HS2168-gen11]MCS4535829.1 hypothetical protein [Corynebacterium sp. HS2168-gen11]
MNTPASRPPTPVLAAVGIAAVQSLLGIAYALVLIVRELRGYRDPALVYESTQAHTFVGYGSAIFFLIVFGTVLIGGWLLTKGHRWGRGPIIMLEMILALNTYFMIGAGQYFLAAIVGFSAVAALALMFSPPALVWASETYGTGK